MFEPQQDDGGFVVTFPDWPEVITQGESLEEAFSEAEDALEEVVANRIATKQTIPVASAPRSGMHPVAVPAPTAVKAALYAALREDNRSQLELAALLRVDGREIRRLLDPYHPTRLTRIDELLRRLGKRLDVGVSSTSIDAAAPVILPARKSKPRRSKDDREDVVKISPRRRPAWNPAASLYGGQIVNCVCMFRPLLIMAGPRPSAFNAANLS